MAGQELQASWVLAVMCGLLIGMCSRVLADCDLQQCKGGPVCGQDGLTYQNRCFADCAGVEIADPSGPCKGVDSARASLAAYVAQLANAIPNIKLASTSSRANASDRTMLFQDPLSESDVFRFAHLGLRLVGRQAPVPLYSSDELQTLPTRQARGPAKNNTHNNSMYTEQSGAGLFLIQRLTREGGLYASIMSMKELTNLQTKVTAGRRLSNIVGKNFAGRKLRNIIGKDDLVGTKKPYQSPYRYVGHVSFKGRSQEVGWCTGGLIGPYTVMTAGHCVYHLKDSEDPESYMYPIMYFFPGRRYLYAKNKTANPYGVYNVAHKSVLKYYSNSAYMAASENSITWDVGLLELEAPIQYGFFDLGIYDTSKCHDLMVVGYPGHKTAKYAGSQWHTTCKACPKDIVTETTLVAVDCDWTPGISGAPLFVKDGDRYKIIGIATGEYMSGSEYYPLNIGTTITTFIYAGVSRYMSIT